MNFKCFKTIEKKLNQTKPNQLWRLQVSQMSYLLHTWQPTLLMISKLFRYMWCGRFLVFLWRIPWWLWEMHRKTQWKWMPQRLQPIPSLHLEVGTLALLLLVAFLVSVSSSTRLKKKGRDNVSISFPFFFIKLQHSIIICKDYKESSEQSPISSFHGDHGIWVSVFRSKISSAKKKQTKNQQKTMARILAISCSVHGNKSLHSSHRSCICN